MKNNKHDFVVGDIVKALVNGKYFLQGEIIYINDDNDTVVVAIPVYYGSVIDYIAVESKLEDLLEIKKDIEDFDNIH